MPGVPDREECIALLEKYRVSDSVMEHILAVHDYAMEIAENVKCDRALVEAGSLLHDIGRSVTHNIDHAIAGAEILKKDGIDQRVIDIVERHIGSGLDPEEAEYLGLPKREYLQRTIEEKLVGHADNLIGRYGRVSIKDTIEMVKNKWSPNSVKRLIDNHFLVFKPEPVRLVESIYVKNEDVMKDINETINKKTLKMDVLYKIKMDNDRCTINFFGRDALKAKNTIIKKIGIPETVNPEEPFLAEIIHLDKRGILLRSDKDYTITAETLKKQLKVDNVQDAINRYGFISHMPLRIMLKDNGYRTNDEPISAELSKGQLKKLRTWKQDKDHRLIMNRITKNEAKKIVENKCGNNIKNIKRLGVLCQCIQCKQRPSAELLNCIKENIIGDITIIN